MYKYKVLLTVVALGASSEQMKKRLQNSLPWSLSRLLASLWKKKK